MKNLLLFLATLFTVSLYGQYQPFVQEGSSWAYKIEFYPEPQVTIPVYFRIVIGSDTLVNDVTYHKLFGTEDLNETLLIGLIREEDKRVYFTPYETETFPWASYSPCVDYQDEIILYDFNVSVNDEMALCGDKATVIETGTIELSGFELPWYNNKYFEEHGEKVVTGIGSISEGFFGPSLGFFENYNFFQCVSNGDIQYVEPGQNFYTVGTDCQKIVSTNDIVVEEVKILPNPVSSYIRIKSDVDFTDYTIYGINGDNIAAGKINDNEISINDITPGSYFVQLNYGDKYAFKHFIKQ